MVATHFSGNAIKIEVFENKKKTDCLAKNGGTTSCPFSRPSKKWVLLFFVLLFFFFLFLLHLARGCSKKTYFYGFLHTLLKHLVTSCSNNEVKPKLPPKKVHNCFFSETSFFDQKQLSKTLILHHPLKTVHKNISKNLFL